MLVDGFVRATWRLVRTGRAAALIIEPLERIGRKDRRAMTEEGRGLLAFAAGDARSCEVRFANP